MTQSKKIRDQALSDASGDVMVALYSVSEQLAGAKEIAKVALLRQMSYVGKQWYFGDWHDGAALRMWDAIHAAWPEESRLKTELEQLKQLQQLAVGWWIWDRAAYSPRFLTTHEWIKHPDSCGDFSK